jgi:hypothetical protein
MNCSHVIASITDYSSFAPSAIFRGHFNRSTDGTDEHRFELKIASAIERSRCLGAVALLAPHLAWGVLLGGLDRWASVSSVDHSSLVTSTFCAFSAFLRPFRLD